MSNEIKVETIKWEDSPRVREWKKQHKIKTENSLCKHLQGVYKSYKLEADREGEVPYNQPCVRCKLCDKELQEWDLKKIQQTLEKFKKLKK